MQCLYKWDIETTDTKVYEDEAELEGTSLQAESTAKHPKPEGTGGLCSEPLQGVQPCSPVGLRCLAFRT